MASMRLRHPRTLVFFALALTYVVGFTARFEDFGEWRKPEHRSAFFFENRPMLATADGYYYLRFAQELIEGRYVTVDSQRQFPDAPLRPNPPPFLSVLTAGLHNISTVSIDWIAVFLSVFLAPLLAIPVYFLARASGGGRVMGVTAALFVVCSEYYAGRTRIGSYDTDCLVVTLFIWVCYSVARFAQTDERSRYVHGGLALLGYGLFWWLWDTGAEAASASCLGMFAVAIAGFYRAGRRETLTFGAAVGVVGLVVGLWRGWNAPLNLARSVAERIAFLSGSQPGPFPATIGSLWELEVLGFGEMARLNAGNVVVFVMAWVGFGWFLFCRRKRALLFLVPGALALFSFFFGNRFLVFQLPVLALGVGYVADRLWKWRGVWKPAAWVVPVVAALPAALCFSNAVSGLYAPRLARSAGAFGAVIERTSEDGILWNDWYHGHPLLYYTGRACVTDALSIEGERLVYQNIPLATANARLAANFIQFWCGNGQSGMDALYAAMRDDHAKALSLLKSVCAAGPGDSRARVEAAIASGLLSGTPTAVGSDGSVAKSRLDQWMRFFFPRLDRPPYVLVMRELTESPEWFRRGTWNPAAMRGVDAFYRAYTGVRRVGSDIRGPRALRVDTRAGTIYQQNPDGLVAPYPLTHLLTRGDSIEVTTFDNADGFAFEWIPALGFGAAMSPAIAESMFNQMFIRHESDSGYFRPVSVRTPAFHLWRVRGDSLERPNE